MTTSAHYDSFDLMEDIVKSVFRPVGFDTVRLLRSAPTTARAESRLIRMDVVENEQAYRISAELTGIKKEDISVSIEGNRVIISAESKLEKASANLPETVLSNERFYGNLRRSIQLPGEIDESVSQAKYTDGVLELTLFKQKQRTTKKLEIN